MEKRCKRCGVILFPREHKVERERGICIACEAKEFLKGKGVRNGTDASIEGI